MIVRHLSNIAFSDDFGRQMRFITGPRQSGKTTLAKQFLSSTGCEKLYYNWDNRKIRDSYLADNHFFSSDIYNVNLIGNKHWICMDEIHKYPKWKNLLKDFFDSFGDDHGFIVTGSAKLDMIRKSGDSLAGRYFSFRLNPIVLSELLNSRSTSTDKMKALDFIGQKLASVKYHEEEMSALLKFSGFPEPLLAGNERFFNKWRSDYFERILKEDLRDLADVEELENLAKVMYLLPERIASPLSINSIANDVKCAFATASNYIKALELGYLIFRIPPYNRKIARAIKKETKAYFYDWTRIPDPAKRFENYIAVELKGLLDSWSDSGHGNFSLNFIRDRDGRETDFLILDDDKPWLMIEAKYSRSEIEYHHMKNRDVLGEIPFVQVVREDGIAEKTEDGIFQISASRFFA
ncbi:MAG: AAA family ATPase [Victivallales bacterium]